MELSIASLSSSLLLLPLLSTLSAAQFVSQDPDLRNLTTVRSPGDTNITVSYKTPEGACTTAFDTQEQYTGWVNVPGDYPTNLFFWYVGAREPTSSLTIWLNGGPGSSSMYGFFTGNGPCEIVEKGMNEYETLAREWGWDRGSNMIFIDQPNQVGYSYNTPTNGTANLLEESLREPPVKPDGIHPLWSQLNGTFNDESQKGVSQTANTTQIAAMAVWHMLQGFLTTISPYKDEQQALDVHLFAESYGGRYGPVFAETFEDQNRKRITGQIDVEDTRDINLVSLGIVNGCVDQEVQIPMYPAFATNNTYGLKALSDAEAAFYFESFNAVDGCGDQLAKCETAAAESDPDGLGTVEEVNKICANASASCKDIEYAYYNFGRSAYDLANPAADPFPSMLFQEYLNQAWVQTATGSPVNYSVSSNAVWNGFFKTGDIARDGNIPRLAALLNSGVRIGLIYGDRDYICNWFGGEAVAEKLSWEAGADYGNGFGKAGYAPIIVNETYIGGSVKQFGNLSFSRVFQAGHAVPAYQPETAFQIFARIIKGNSLSTGAAVDLGNYATEGPPASSTEKQDLPKAQESICYVRSFQQSCDVQEMDEELLERGVVINGVLYKNETDWPLWEEWEKKNGKEGDDSGSGDGDGNDDGGDGGSEDDGGGNGQKGNGDGKGGSKNDDDSDEDGDEDAQTSSTTTVRSTPTEVLTGDFTATETPDEDAAAGLRAPGAGITAAVVLVLLMHLG